MKRLAAFLAGAVLISSASVASAAIIYTTDTNLSDYASSSTNFAVLSNFHAGDTSSSYATTYSSLSSGLRVYDGGSVTGLSGSDYILASFNHPVDTIRVFPNMDHPGAGYDGYQYSIAGSNDGTHWTQLFNALTVSNNGPYTLGSFTGTAPSKVDNVLMTTGHGPGGTVGYIADFKFANSYKFYAFGPSTEAVNRNNTDQELSGVSGAPAVPEPATWAMMLVGLSAIGVAMRTARRRGALALSAA
jgi:hypothetical protein